MVFNDRGLLFHTISEMGSEPNEYFLLVFSLFPRFIVWGAQTEMGIVH